MYLCANIIYCISIYFIAYTENVYWLNVQFTNEITQVFPFFLLSFSSFLILLFKLQTDSFLILKKKTIDVTETTINHL